MPRLSGLVVALAYFIVISLFERIKSDDDDDDADISVHPPQISHHFYASSSNANFRIQRGFIALTSDD